jgi:hypothetical protein
MNGEKIYPLRIGAFAKVMFVGILALMTVAGLAIPFAKPSDGSPPPLIFATFWFGFLGFGWYQILSLPQSIVYHSDGTLEFRAPLRTRSFRIADLHAIEPVPNQFGMLRFRHANGKVVVVNQFDNFHQLVTAIKATNPRVEVRGC